MSTELDHARSTIRGMASKTTATKGATAAPKRPRSSAPSAVLGVEVTVERIELTKDDRLVAICARGKARQSVSVLDLPLPSPAPKGSEWIHAYRRWARGP